MPLNLHNRDFVKEADFTTVELQFLLDLSRDLKRAKASGTEQRRMRGRNVARIFSARSMRTLLNADCPCPVRHNQYTSRPLT